MGFDLLSAQTCQNLTCLGSNHWRSVKEHTSAALYTDREAQPAVHDDELLVVDLSVVDWVCDGVAGVRKTRFRWYAQEDGAMLLPSISSYSLQYPTLNATRNA